MPVYSKATSGQHPFVVAGGITTRYSERENVPKRIWLLPVTSGSQTDASEPELNKVWDQTYTKSKKATLLIYLYPIMDEVGNLD